MQALHREVIPSRVEFLPVEFPFVLPIPYYFVNFHYNFSCSSSHLPLHSHLILLYSYGLTGKSLSQRVHLGDEEVAKALAVHLLGLVNGCPQLVCTSSLVKY